MACADLRGVRSVDFTYAQELEIEATVQLSEPLLDRLGAAVCQEAYRSVNRISLQGAGDLPDTLAAGGSMSVTGLATGVTGISETTEEQEQGRYHRWTVQATNWPHAVAA